VYQCQAMTERLSPVSEVFRKRHAGTQKKVEALEADRVQQNEVTAELLQEDVQQKRPLESPESTSNRIIRSKALDD